jgi:hypothetical protein
MYGVVGKRKTWRVDGRKQKRTAMCGMAPNGALRVGNFGARNLEWEKIDRRVALLRCRPPASAVGGGGPSLWS